MYFPPRTSNPQFSFRDGNFSGSGKIIEICACLNLEVLSVPEGLVYSIGILEAPAVFLVAQMLAAASIKVARNDAEWTKRELLGRTWRRDWAMRNFQRFSGIPEKIWKIRNPGKKSHNRKMIWNWMLWVGVRGTPEIASVLSRSEPNSSNMCENRNRT